MTLENLQLSANSIGIQQLYLEYTDTLNKTTVVGYIHTKLHVYFFVETFFVHNIFTDFFFFEPVRRITLCLLKICVFLEGYAFL